MTNKNVKKQVEVSGGVNPVLAAATGAVVGAGAVIAGAMVMQDEKNRQRVKVVLADAKDKAIGTVEDIGDQVQDKKTEIDGKLAEAKDTVQDVADSVGDSFRQGVQDAKKAADSE